ncbi:uncharacterized protein VTP21DRAFT_70 [Calcarisporiella thermophila]|uniref:uncharacterized protein n=1 Tax=Calcarisporiella thermophila TaxID=911321 RepID=UPI003744397A
MGSGKRHRILNENKQGEKPRGGGGEKGAESGKNPKRKNRFLEVSDGNEKFRPTDSESPAFFSPGLIRAEQALERRKGNTITHACPGAPAAAAAKIAFGLSSTSSTALCSPVLSPLPFHSDRALARTTGLPLLGLGRACNPTLQLLPNDLIWPSPHWPCPLLSLLRRACQTASPAGPRWPLPAAFPKKSGAFRAAASHSPPVTHHGLPIAPVPNREPYTQYARFRKRVADDQSQRRHGPGRTCTPLEKPLSSVGRKPRATEPGPRRGQWGQWQPLLAGRGPLASASLHFCLDHWHVQVQGGRASGARFESQEKCSEA